MLDSRHFHLMVRCGDVFFFYIRIQNVVIAYSSSHICMSCLSGVNGLKMLGVVHDAVVFLLEQLYGARHCRNYKFRFHKPEEPDDPPVNSHGSARAEVYHR